MHKTDGIKKAYLTMLETLDHLFGTVSFLKEYKLIALDDIENSSIKFKECTGVMPPESQPTKTFSTKGKISLDLSYLYLRNKMQSGYFLAVSPLYIRFKKHKVI